ncbi:hypothetical protein H9Q09_11800 [Aurantimonas sp. DM33-3]|uniref:hypothetical protein n=1 Tax=Aurantimonas sp. DM33-3 TaxID=2766955 RepID=UPI0016521C8B|nr:hypothetical protein [Aurantimonas sp. DM33-3]MBC6716891.1 hypothetical protein [Aurantimonas sp. DM33-3]
MANENFERALENWIDDNDPHLAVLNRAELRETAAYRHFADLWFQSRSVENRKKAAAEAAETRANNKAKGISQVNLRGSTKQKKWASEIRGNFLADYAGRHPVAAQIATESETQAKFWIDNRSSLGAVAFRIEDLCAAIDEATGRYNAHLDAIGIEPGQSFTLDDEARRLVADIRAANAALNRYLA